MSERISITPKGRLWAIQHGGSYLGYAPSREAAARIGGHLAEWFVDQGREAAIVFENDALIAHGPRFAPAPERALARLAGRCSVGRDHA